MAIRKKIVAGALGVGAGMAATSVGRKKRDKKNAKAFKGAYNRAYGSSRVSGRAVTARNKRNAARNRRRK